MDRKACERYIFSQYGVEADYPFEGDDVSAVFRHGDNRKWFGIAMRISGSKLGLSSSLVDILNVKITDPVYLDMLIHSPGIFPAYHMNKKHWVTVLLDGSVPEDSVCGLIDMSYQATMSKKPRRSRSD
ncbi:MAG: MmcQ/YjbR family DNA-binding protein [Saccharofermentans sp.]|nr:MmcQ/YjbR family DNA-binding protein [Saccharofermentans sp.]